MTATATLPLGRPRWTAGATAAYSGLLAATVGLAWLATRLGTDSAAPAAVPAPAGHGGGVPAWHLLGVVGAVALLCRAGGLAARRLGQSAVVGEITTGVLLGPSVLGAVSPALLDRLLPAPLLDRLGLLGGLGVAMFAFGLGVDVDGAAIRRRTHAAVWVSHASIAVPFVSGCFLASALGGDLRPGGSFAAFCLFVGAAMSITAFPVLGRILDDTGLSRRPLGQLVIVCAAVDDVTAWVGLSVVVAIARGDAVAGGALRTVALAGCLAVVVLYAARPLLDRAHRRGGVPLPVLLGFALVVAAASDGLGLHAIYGAFLAGCAVPRDAVARAGLRQVAPFVDGLLLPLFFLTAGLKVDLGGLAAHPGRLGFGLLILAVAVAGKLGAAAVAARKAGMPRREALAVGVLMNTRGLTEIVVLDIGLQLGVLPPALYTLMVLMALVTTAMTTPLLRLLGVTGPGRDVDAE